MPVAQKRDLLDDLIDIQSDWQALSNPFEGMVESLDPEQRKVFTPADYKEKPFANSNRCLCTASGVARTMSILRSAPAASTSAPPRQSRCTSSPS